MPGDTSPARGGPAGLCFCLRQGLHFETQKMGHKALTYMRTQTEPRSGPPSRGASQARFLRLAGGFPARTTIPKNTSAAAMLMIAPAVSALL